jgi:pimeloyl-ACP methyl ester carboxylesterase
VPYSLHVRHYKKPKKPRATVLFIHGIGNSGDAWHDVIDRLPADVRVITIDLLGFGNSPRPKWAVYNARTQANAVLATYLKLRITSQVIIVGHSLGSLVAIEIAKRYPLLVDSLILCSPPLYDTSDTKNKLLPKSDKILRDLFKTAQKRPENFVKLSAFAMKYNLINRSFSVTPDNVEYYMAALESTILNQTSYNDAHALKTKTLIIKGALDPFVINKNLRKLAKSNKNISLATAMSGHEVRGLFVIAVVKAIKDRLEKKT